MRNKSIFGLILVIILFASGCNQAKPNESVSKNDNGNANSTIVAKVGSINITEEQLNQQVEVKKKAFENLKKPQTDEFYKKVALGLLIRNALVDNEVEKRGISVSPQEVSEYLTKQAEQMQALSDNDPAKIQYLQDVKLSGFDNPVEYSKSPKVIATVQKIMARAKLRQIISQSSSQTGDPWQKFIDDALGKKQYEIYVPIDITGFQEAERIAVTGK